MYKVRRVYLVTTKGGDGHNTSIIISPSDASYAMKRSGLFYRSDLIRSGSDDQDDQDFLCRGGGVFFCIFLLMMVQIAMLGAILACKLFDLDIIPDYGGRSNKQIHNITDYNYYHERHHIYD